MLGTSPEPYRRKNRLIRPATDETDKLLPSREQSKDNRIRLTSACKNKRKSLTQSERFSYFPNPTTFPIFKLFLSEKPAGTSKTYFVSIVGFSGSKDSGYDSGVAFFFI